MEKSSRHSIGAFNDDEETNLELKFQNEDFLSIWKASFNADGDCHFYMGW